MSDIRQLSDCDQKDMPAGSCRCRVGKSGVGTGSHIVLAPLDPACRLAEHPIESLEIVLNENQSYGRDH